MASAVASSVRVPPHSIEAEISVLGALMLDKDAIVATAEFLHPEHFYDEKHKKIYKAIVKLYEERTPVDILTVSEELKKTKSLKEVGGATNLAELANKVPTAAHVEHYAKIVKDHSIKRSLMSAAAKMFDLAMDEGLPTVELLDKAESEVFNLTQNSLSKSFTHIKSTLSDSFDRLDELHKTGGGVRGVSTGYKDIDNVLSGFQNSNLIILAARPGMGKTSLSLNIAQHVAVKNRKSVAFFSLEMSKEELVDRLLVGEADIDAWKLKTGKLSENDFTSLSNAMGVLAEAPIYIDDTPGLSVLEMRSKARRLQVEYGIDLIIVDYLQLAKSRNLENRVNEVSEISQGMKNLARELKVPVLCLSQLSRAVESRGVKQPMLSDLRDSGCLAGDTLITLANSGQRVEISSLVGKKNIPILSLNRNFKLVRSKFSKVFTSGRKQVYKLRLKSGKTITASANHPFLLIEGWRRLDKLEVGDRIAVPRVINIKAKSVLSKNKLIVLAHMIGDGCFVRRQPIHYTNSDIGMINIVKKAALEEFDIDPRVVQQKTWYHLYLSSKEKLARGRRNPIAKWLDEELGIYGQRSREKTIPEVIFEQSNENISLFLKHIWATDGCIHISKQKKNSKIRLYYASGSKKLAQSISSLLLRLGIVSKINSTKKTGYQDMWSVDIQGKIQQQKFLKEVGIVGKKAKTVKKAISILRVIKENPNNDVVPKEVWQTINRLRIQKNLTAREFSGLMGWSYSGTQRHKNGIGRKRLAKISKVLQSSELSNLSSSDIFWDEVREIKSLGVQEVFDATVPDNANFIANDILVHNSIEQDADVVMFLWREDEDNREKMLLEVSKHRHGGLGQIELHFKGERVKFLGMEHKR